MDPFIEKLPFFTNEHRTLAQSIETFVEREIEPRSLREIDVDQSTRDYISVLAQAGVLSYAVATPGKRLDVRSLCLIRETLAYSSALADVAFVMQGLGTYAISQAAPDHVRDFWLNRAAEGRAIAAFALTEPAAGSDVASIKTDARVDAET